MNRRDPHQIIAGLSAGEIHIKLDTYDLCCVVALHLKATSSAVGTFDEEEVLDLFEQICDVVEGGVDKPRVRAGFAIDRLRAQRMLARVDSGALIDTGYTTTSLAAAISEVFIQDNALTRESLILLTRRLLANLSEVHSEAKKATSEEGWRECVIDPLVVTVRDLIDGIERRQRGLDAAQENIQKEISMLLSEEWFDAIERAQELLDETSETLAELHTILVRETAQFMTLLEEMLDLAEEANNPTARQTIQHVIDQIDRITIWGRSRQRAWSDYYQYVLRYLRDVVRLDPDRALSHRLREQILGWPRRPFFLLRVKEERIHKPREAAARIILPEVTRAAMDYSILPMEVSRADDLPPLEELVSRALTNGARTLRGVCEEVLKHYPEEEHFLWIGRITERVARLSDRNHSPPWVELSNRIRVEDLTLEERSS